jgi:hypothetical protein
MVNYCAGLVTDCAFVDNVAQAKGGGVWNSVQGSSVLTIVKCTFIGNRAALQGGAVRNYACSPEIVNCLFTGNSAEYGGAACDMQCLAEYLNCSFNGNEASAAGGAVCSEGGGATQVAGCILWENIAGTEGHEIYVDALSTALATYSCIEDGWPGTGNIGEDLVNHDPLFVAPGYWHDNGTPGDPSDDYWVDGDYHLSASSPCIDAGDPASALTEDLDGNPRPVGSGYDMGAYERQ